MTRRADSNKTNGKKKPDDKKIKDKEFLMVGIGASAGGIKALKEFFAAMPADSGMAFVVILHLSQTHESSLAHILQNETAMRVEQVSKTVKVEPNNVYVIPPAKGLAMVDGHIKLTEPTRIKGKRVPIDLFFRTLADAYGKNGIAVVLSGTGSDGTLGLKRVKENGGIGIAQEPLEAEYDGMPRSAISTGLVDLILPVGEMPERIIGLRDTGEKIRLPQEKDEIPRPKRGREPDALNEILALVRVRTGHDFSCYKQATVLRRIARRLQVHNLTEMPEYLAYLRENAEEAGALQRDLLITVTNFFRDKEAFEVLEKEIIPKLFAGKTSADTVRVWSVACATGEEAYSLAILLDEYASRITDAPKIQVFASDINEDAIGTGRECFYEETIVADVSPERLRHYFTKENGGYRVRKELRETVLFAPHNILRDPPFSKLDLIVCRNLLIYFNRETQEKVLGIFNFALRRDGFLFLGASESAEGASALFSVVDKKHRLYKTRPATQFQPLPILPAPGGWNVRIPQLPIEKSEDSSPVSYGEIHYKLVEQFAPPSILVSEDYEILHVSEHADRFLRVTVGEPTRNLLKTVNPALKLDLQSALFEAKKDGAVSESRNVRLKIEDEETLVNITVRLLQKPDAADTFYLVVFDESKSAAAPEEAGQTAQTIAGRDAADGIVRRLEQELQLNRERLRATIEQNETSTEELKASNEELQAMNEELRSTSEELETGKEELQSLNEELTTVNHELKDKVDETGRVNSDLQNLIASTDIGTIFLDRALKIKRYTPRVAEIFNIIPSDIGRPLEHITHKLEDDHLSEDAGEVLQTLRLKEREMRGGENDSRYLVRLAPYRTLDDKIDGVVLSFQDITDLKRASDALAKSEERFAAIVNQNLAGIVELDLNGKVVFVNDRFCQTLGYSCEEILEMPLGDFIHAEDLPESLARLEQLKTENQPFEIEKRLVRKDGSIIWVHNYDSPIKDADGKLQSVAIISVDITERKRIEQALHEKEMRLEFTLESAKGGDWDLDLLTGKAVGSFRHDQCFGATEPIPDWSYEKFLTYVHPEDRENEDRKFQAAVASGEDWNIDCRVVWADGSIHWIESAGRNYHYVDGKPTRMLGMVREVTDRKDAEAALRESEERLRLMIESADDFAIFAFAKDGTVNYWNIGAEKIFGYTENEIIGKNGEILFTPADRENGVPDKEMQTTLETGRAAAERRHIRKDGSLFYASGVMTLLSGGKIEGFVKIARDMTDRLEAEKARNQKEILQKMVGAQEDERRRIAQDLHDHLGQQLTALRLKIESVKLMCGDNEALCERVEETQALTAQIDAQIDFLAWEMRPSALDDIGLAAALANFVGEWSKHFGIPADFNASRFGKKRLAPAAETHLYRITQEALNNVFKHARATSVDVSLEHRNGFAVLVVEDDGIGFAPDKQVSGKPDAKRIGLSGMKERAALIGGNLEIESAPGKGTTIFVRVPVPEAGKEKKDEQN